MTEELENEAGRTVVNPGELLRSERERVGFSTEEVAKHLHLSRATLGYLEEGRFDRLPGDTFTRGYIRSYARLLKLDPNTLAQHYDRYVGRESREAKVATINRVVIAPRRGARWVMGVSTVLIVTCMLVLGLWWWNDSRNVGLTTEDSDLGALIDNVQVDSMALPEDFTNPGMAESVDPGAAARDIATPDETQVETETTATDEAVIEAETPAASPAPVELDAAIDSAASTETTAGQPASGKGLSMTFSDNCWVQVSLPGGRVLHSGQMRPGQTLNIEQQGPLDLVIGAADAVSTIEYNGQPVELSAHRQSGVARLRLGQ
ncbi:MAG: RodZ domain-containing protein [Pseudomonas sp.]